MLDSSRCSSPPDRCKVVNHTTEWLGEEFGKGFGHANGDDPKVIAVGELSTAGYQAVGVAPRTR